MLAANGDIILAPSAAGANSLLQRGSGYGRLGDSDTVSGAATGTGAGNGVGV